MVIDTLTEEIMSHVQYRTELNQTPLTVQQYNAVAEGVTEWIKQGGEKVKNSIANLTRRESNTSTH